MQSHLQILLVEDDPGAAGLIRAMLGHVVHADRLETALAALRQRSFDAVLLDLGLPDGYGLEVLARVRELAPEVPVIVLTGNLDERLSVQAVQQGAQDYLTKEQIAVYPPLLERSIRYAIERQRILLVAAQVDALRERERQLRRLNEMGEFLQACQSADEAFKVIGRAGAELFSRSLDGAADLGGGMGLLDASGNMEAGKTWGGLPGRALGRHRSDCWSLRRGRAHLNLEGAGGLRCPHWSDRIGPTLCVPLIAEAEFLGIVCLAGEGEAARPRVRELAPLATAFAEYAGLALANLRLREKLQIQAIRDPLTGLLNRRYLEDALAREMTRAQRTGEPLGVLMLDLNDFKGYNDQFGHGAGDRLLESVGRLLEAHCRGSDMACRYGGDEFVLILPATAAEVIAERAEQLRSEALLLPAERTVSLSVGAAVSPEAGTTVSALLGAADEAMYAAKRSRGAASSADR